MRHDPIGTGFEAVLVFFLQVGHRFAVGNLATRKPSDLGDLGVVDVEDVAHAAHHIVIDHGSLRLQNLNKARMVKFVNQKGKRKARRPNNCYTPSDQANTAGL